MQNNVVKGIDITGCSCFRQFVQTTMARMERSHFGGIIYVQDNCADLISIATALSRVSRHPKNLDMAVRHSQVFSSSIGLLFSIEI